MKPTSGRHPTVDSTGSSSLWHPFSSSAAIGDPFVVDRAEGVWLWTEEGERVLDATASLWYCNIGHCRPEMAEAIAKQAGRLDAYHLFGDVSNRPAESLADVLASLAPVDDPRIFLTTGGGDGIETAVKLARRYWAARGETDRVHLIGRTGAYHGVFGYGTSLGGIDQNRLGFGPLLNQCSTVPYDSVESLKEEFDRVGADRVAAFVLEPVIGAGGVLHPPADYIQSVAQACDEAGVLFVCDSVICGFGRLGTWFGIERFNVQPDMIVFAKGVSSGYLPIGGVVVDGRIANGVMQDGGPLRHGTTYAGHPIACAAALRNLEILEDEELLDRSIELEQVLADELSSLEAHAAVSEVRAGLGFMGAVELHDELLGDANGPGRVAAAARAEGVLVRPLDRCVAVSPPLVATPEHVKTIRLAVQTALDQLTQAG